MHTEVTYLTGRAIVRFMDDRGNPFQGVEARCILYDRTGKKVSGFKQQSSVTGAIFVDFEDDSLRVGGYMEAEFEDQGFRYRERVYFEPAKRTYAVQFLPEGGKMLSGVLRRIAFKCEGSDGFPMEVQGCVLNRSGDTVTTFRSEHDGMGSFFMQGVAGEQYRAVCTSEDGMTAAVFSKYGSSAVKIIRAYNDKGEQLFETELAEPVKNVSCDGRHVSVLTDSFLYQYDRGGTVVGQAAVDADSIRPFTDGRKTYVYVLGGVRCYDTTEMLTENAES